MAKCWLAKEMFRAHITGTNYVYYTNGTIHCFDKEDNEPAVYLWQVFDSVIWIFDPNRLCWIPHVETIQVAYQGYLARMIVCEKVPKRSEVLVKLREWKDICKNTWHWHATRKLSTRGLELKKK